MTLKTRLHVGDIWNGEESGVCLHFCTFKSLPCICYLHTKLRNACSWAEA